MRTAPHWQEVGPLSRTLRADNPGPMTLTGTNSYALGTPGGGTVVVDPGPLLEPHLAALAGAGEVELILITHRHPDHTEGSALLHELTGAPVRAVEAAHCHGGDPLADGELIRAAGLAIEVLATPGHTADSACFLLRDDGGNGSVLTGDTVLGQGTTVLDHPDGRLGDYLASLERLVRAGAGGPVTVLPGHGPMLPDLAAIATAYAEHRHERLAQVRAAVDTLRVQGDRRPDAGAVARIVYGDVAENVRGAALLSVQAQLEYLYG